MTSNICEICMSFAATTLTSWHLLVTFCSLHVALWMKFFEHKPFDSRTVMGFGVLNGISIGLLNLSLGFNSVGFYQVRSLSMFLMQFFHQSEFIRYFILVLQLLLVRYCIRFSLCGDTTIVTHVKVKVKVSCHCHVSYTLCF